MLGTQQLGTFELGTSGEEGGTFAFGQAQASIRVVRNSFAQAQAKIIPARVFAQAQGFIYGQFFGRGQAQAFLRGIEFDTYSTGTASGFTHTPIGIPRGIVLLAAGSDSANTLTAVTYGGVSMTKLRHDERTSGAQSQTEIWFLGSNIPTGPQTISFSTPGHFSAFTCVSFTSQNRDIVVNVVDGGNGTNTSTISILLPYNNKLSIALIDVGPHNSGSPLSGETLLNSGGVPNGTYWHGYQTTPSQTDFTAGVTQSASDYAITVAAFTQSDTISLRGYGQAQAFIRGIYGHGQAQSKINAFGVKGYGQSQADIKQTYNAFGQSSANIKQIYQGYGQSQARITNIYQVYGQAQACIKGNAFGQAQADIKQIYQGYAQSQSDITQIYFGFGQSQAKITSTYQNYGQSQADIKQNYNGFGQANSDILAIGYGFAQAQADIEQSYQSYGQCQAIIAAHDFIAAYGQAQADIKSTSRKFAQANSLITASTKVQSGNSAAYILKSAGYGQAAAQIVQLKGWGQAQAQIKNLRIKAWGQAQALIVNKKKHGQAQANIKRANSGYGQAQAFISKSRGQGQANARIIKFGEQVFGQAQAYINNFGRGQAQASILATYRVFGQSNADIKSISRAYGQAQAYIRGYAFGQAQAKILSKSNKFGQTQALITSNVKQSWGQAQGFITIPGITTYLLDTFTRSRSIGTGLGTPDVGPAWAGSAEPLSVDGSKLVFDNNVTSDGDPTYGYAYPYSNINVVDSEFYGEFSLGSTDNYVDFEARYTTVGFNYVYANVNSLGTWFVGSFPNSISPTSASFPLTANVMYAVKLNVTNKTAKFKIWALAGSEPGSWLITHTDASMPTNAGDFAMYTDNSAGLAATFNYFDNFNVYSIVVAAPQGYGQAQASIFSPTKLIYGQAQAKINTYNNNKHGLAMASILAGTGFNLVYAQANAYILGPQGFGQAQATIFNPWALGQAAARITQNVHKVAQAQAYIKGYYFGQAQAMITRSNNGYGQAAAKIAVRIIKSGQAQASIATTYPVGQAQARISRAGVTNPDGTSNPEASYLVMFNGYELPGYAQEESIDSVERVKTFQNPYRDISFSEYQGLENKNVSLRMLVVGENYLDCKNQIELAGTLVRSKKDFTSLYIQYEDRYYVALTKSIKMGASTANIRTAEYTVDFECKPWLISNTTKTVSGTSTVGRTLDDGGWTPATVRFTGTNVTVSGYTETGDFTGFISVSGTVTDYTYPYEELYIGPGVTHFGITGATDYVITYNDRWYL